VIHEFRIATHGKGLYEITGEVVACLSQAGFDEGLCTVFVQHTSASLCIQENADPSARHDLEGWLDRLVAEGDPHFTHTQEGADDMPSHIKSALTNTSIGIPVVRGRLALGTWQGIFLWEHRASPQRRSLVVHLGG
jgi:secondary thiamine-phosphate synthase enzyme